MNSINLALKKLLEYLLELQIYPPTQNVSIVEISGEFDKNGRLSVGRDMLLDPDVYEARFEEIMRIGYAWINISCYGLYEDKLVVGIELPESMPQNPVKTSINYSGPPNIVLEHKWNVEKILEVKN
ncbi:hypothetical protein KKF34_01680 [Myxococcota bacterium]|nr:hypothetical protein [Myxococcota bacterium]MBU1382067.1 hypothetical protein [Myxococcota bacterium]MBU1495569.1 hypothetical protein [Myxococcota bacterium]